MSFQHFLLVILWNQASISNGFRAIQRRMWRNCLTWLWYDFWTKVKVKYWIILVLIDFSYATSYRLSIVTFAIARNV